MSSVRTEHLLHGEVLHREAAREPLGERLFLKLAVFLLLLRWHDDGGGPAVAICSDT